MFQHGFHFGALFGEISSEFSEFQELEAAPGVAKTMIGEAGFVCVLMSEKKNSTWGCRWKYMNILYCIYSMILPW